MNTNTALQVDNESLASRAADALQQLLYSAHAFAAIVIPVSITMILSSLAVVFINDGLNGQSSGGQGIPVVFQESAEDSAETRFTNALVNSLVIVGVIIGATFLMVFLYLFRFMKLLIGYLVISTSLLLAFSTGLVVQTAVMLLDIPTDAITYSIIFYNFAIVGVISVFYQKGVPPLLTGGYLIAISVTMAWILIRYLPEWTAWVLLGVLAFYDLCAVLTPCGPLRWLVGIMQERDEPLPGLLYEARVQQANNNNNNDNSDRNSPSSNAASSVNGNPIFRREASRQETRSDVEAQNSNAAQQPPSSLSGPPLPKPPRPPRSSATSLSNALRPAVQGDEDQTHPPANTATSSFAQLSSTRAEQSAAATNTRPTPTVRANHESEPTDYDDYFEEDRSIKLGLGDFVFYSILCAKAALVSFTTFITVFVVVLFGLAMTLVLLAVYRTALPALPISILLGLVFFFAADNVMVPFVNSFALQMAYS